MRSQRSRTVRTAVVLAVALSTAWSLPGAGWKRIGGTGVAAGFAGPVGGPVDDAWFSADGRRLYASLQDDSLWVSEDAGLSWLRGTRDDLELRAALDSGTLGNGPAAVLLNPYRSGVSYALGEHLYRSDDGGGEWSNLTALGSESVIGRWQAVLAISPADPEFIVVGNSMGLWKSHDAGETWASLNGSLPNFPRVRFRSAVSGTTPTPESPRFGALGLVRTAGGPVWRASQVRPRAGLVPEPRQVEALGTPLAPPGYEVSRRVWKDGRPISGDLTACAGEQHACAQHAITAFASNGRLWAGTSNGRLWVSDEDGAAWMPSWTVPDGEGITRLWADPGTSTTGLALAGGRVLRSTDGGNSWLDISGNLPESAWTSVQGHPEGSTAYVAGPAGIYFVHVDLRRPSPTGTWTRVAGDLPAGEIADLVVEPLRGRLYVAMPGHGIFWTRTPQADRALRVLSAADLTARPVAPGSLLTVLGARAVRANADGHPVPILDAGLDRTQLQVPFAVEGRSLRLHLDVGGPRHVVELPLQEVSPAVFIVSGEPLILDAGTGGLIGWSRPARPGASVLVMATGLGEVAPSWPAGVPSRLDDPPRTMAVVEAFLAGSPARVVASHLAPGYVGIYIVEVAVPSDARPGSASLSIRAGGRLSNQVSLVIGQPGR